MWIFVQNFRSIYWELSEIYMQEFFSFLVTTYLLTEWITLAGSRGSFDPKNRKWKWNLQEMNNYISCFWNYYLIGYTYVDTCSKFQIDLLRNVWDMHSRIFFIFNFKTGNEIEINRKWIFTFHVFEFIIL